MKPEHPNEDDRRLRGLLREWQVDAPLPPRFNEQVWRRIARPPAPALGLGFWRAPRAWIGNALPRPALALSYATVLLVVGAGAGWSQARRQTRRVDAALGWRYVQTIDPYLANSAAAPR